MSKQETPLQIQLVTTLASSLLVIKYLKWKLEGSFMKIISFLTLLFLTTVNVNAAIVDFEEDNWGGNQFIGTYEGITFSSEWRIWDDYTSSIYPQGSGQDAIYSHEFGGSMDFNDTVDISSLWLASANVGQSIYFQGFDDLNNLLYTSSIYNGGFDGTVNLGWNGVEFLTMVSSSYNHFIIDDINYSAVPEPASIALLGLALASFGFSRKKKNA